MVIESLVEVSGRFWLSDVLGPRPRGVCTDSACFHPSSHQLQPTRHVNCSALGTPRHSWSDGFLGVIATDVTEKLQRHRSPSSLSSLLLPAITQGGGISRSSLYKPIIAHQRPFVCQQEVNDHAQQPPHQSQGKVANVDSKAYTWGSSQCNLRMGLNCWDTVSKCT